MAPEIPRREEKDGFWILFPIMFGILLIILGALIFGSSPETTCYSVRFTDSTTATAVEVPCP